MSWGMSQTLQRMFLFLALTVSLVIVVTYLFSMGLGIVVMFSTAEGLTFSQSFVNLHPFLLMDAQITVNAGLYFIFLWWIFAVCFAAAWKYKDSLSQKLRELSSGNLGDRAFGNNLLSMPIITTMLLFLVFLLHTLQSGAGIPTGEPSVEDPFLSFLQFSRAPLIEELLFRVFPIGSFLVAYIFVVGKAARPQFSWRQRLKTCFLSILHPEGAKRRVGLKTIGEGGLFGGGIGGGEWTMVVFTAALFGIAHYLGGWGPGKVSQAAVSGFVWALAYLYYGIQAPLLLHWYSNYYFTVFALSEEHFSAQVGFTDLIFAANFFLGVLMWLGVGFFGLTAFVNRLRNRANDRSATEILSD